MNISTLSPLTNLPKPHEMSSLRSPRDADSIYKLWQKLYQVVERDNKISQLMNQMSREFKRLEGQDVVDFEFFPFKIYTVPTIFRPQTDQAQYTSSINWRTVRVRGGLVLTTLVTTGSYVNGTDGMQNYAYYNYLPANSVGSYDIQVPANTPQYWFWIETSGSYSVGSPSPYYLRYSSTPQTPDSSGNPNGWSGFPSTTNNLGSPNLVIGYVDTYTSSSQNHAYVRQILDTDVLAAGTNISSSNWFKGTYNSLVTYYPGDGVQLFTGGNAGTWISIATSSIVGMAPIFPIPVPPSSSYWANISLGIQAQSTCVAGTTKTQYFNATTPS